MSLTFPRLVTFISLILLLLSSGAVTAQKFGTFNHTNVSAFANLEVPNEEDYFEAECGEIPNGPATFDYHSVAITAKVKRELGKLKDIMFDKPQCSIIVTGSLSGIKFQQQLDWLRLYNVIDYMAETYQIDRHRFCSGTGTQSNENSLYYKGKEDRDNCNPDLGPEPFPFLREKMLH